MSIALKSTRPSYMPKLHPTPSSYVFCLEGQQDAYSSTIRDISGNKNHGTIFGATWVRLPSGMWALNSNNVDDVITISPSTSFNTPNGITVLIWVNIETFSTSSGGLICKSPLGSSYGDWDLTCTGTGQVGFDINNNAKSITSGTNLLSLNTWTLVSGTYGKDLLTIRFNTTIVGQSTAYTTDLVDTPTNNVYLGVFYVDAAARRPKGKRALTRVIGNVALTGAQIGNIYYSERSLFGV